MAYDHAGEWSHKLISLEQREQFMASRNPNPDDAPYRPAPGPGHPDYTPPPPIRRPTPPTKLAGGPALPGEPGRPGTPKAPGGRPHLPGEKPTPAPAGTNPQLAQVDYTSPHPKFDQHMKNTPPLSQPKDRIDHLKKGVIIRKA